MTLETKYLFFTYQSSVHCLVGLCCWHCRSRELSSLVLKVLGKVSCCRAGYHGDKNASAWPILVLWIVKEWQQISQYWCQKEGFQVAQGEVFLRQR